MKEKESDLQKYREKLRQEQNRLEEQRWLLLQQIETEFTTVKESQKKTTSDIELETNFMNLKPFESMDSVQRVRGVIAAFSSCTMLTQ